MSGSLPDAFVLPFSFDQRRPWLEVLNKLTRGDSSVRLDHIERVNAGSEFLYRVRYSFCDDQRKPLGTAFLEFAPSNLWVITKGALRTLAAPGGWEWTIEYGNSIDGVPIVKKSDVYTFLIDEKTGIQTNADPSKHIVVEVNSAEPYDVVNASDYDPATYGIEIPKFWNPSQGAEMPLAMYIAMSGAVLFVVGVLLIHFSRRRSGKDSAKPPPPLAA